VATTRTASASGRAFGPAPLATLFRGRHNSIGFLRWTLAALVVVDHSFPVGGFSGGVDPTWTLTRGQDSLGGIAVAGFFVLSGFLVTRSWFSSASVFRFVWRRFLRIFPGFWVCLIATVFVFAPIAWWHEHGTLTGLFSLEADSPRHYVTANFWLHIHQWNIDHMFSSSQFANTGYEVAWNGSLWTLVYEFKCYLLLAGLGLAGVLTLPSVVAILTLICYGFMLSWKINPEWAPLLLPILGDVNVARFLFLFLLGSLFALYADRIVIDDRLGILALLLTGLSLRQGGWLLIGYPAFAYLLMWASIRLPLAWFERPGDFSYGTYIYAFPVQMLLAESGLRRHGVGAFVAGSIGATTVVAVASWHLIEKRALRLKNWRLPVLRRRPPVGRSPSGPSAIEDDEAALPTAGRTGVLE